MTKIEKEYVEKLEAALTPKRSEGSMERIVRILCEKLPRLLDGANMKTPAYRGKPIGVRLCTDNGRVSVQLDHPLEKFWLSLLKPEWKARREQVCKSCSGTGWDGETYTLSCHECGGTGKPNGKAET